MALAAASSGFGVAASFDQDHLANQVYLHFHGRRPARRNLCGLKPAEVLRLSADGWLLSPPCQPYTCKGKQQDLDDPRAKPLLNLINLLPRCRPELLFLENVPPFAESGTRELLCDALEECRLHYREVIICPTQMGIPNKRRRYYLLASKKPLTSGPPRPPRFQASLSDYLSAAAEQNDDLVVLKETIRRLDPAEDIVGRDGTAGCFGSSYGRAYHGAGSYLLTEEADSRSEPMVRRFSPAEILRLLHFPPELSFPRRLSLRDRYRLSGNSVNVAVVAYLLRWLGDRSVLEREFHRESGLVGAEDWRPGDA